MVRSSSVWLSGIHRFPPGGGRAVALRAAYERHRSRSDLNWRQGLSVLRTDAVSLRELKAADAPALLQHVSSLSVRRYIAPPPRTVDDFKRFISRTLVERRRGTQLSFAIVPEGQSGPVGLVQVWAIEPDFSTAEWGFVLGESMWGTGLFGASARLLLDFAFTRLGVMRLEMRIVEANVRGNEAMKKLGAIREGTLRSGFRSGDTFMDHAMWSILADEWRARRARSHDTTV